MGQDSPTNAGANTDVLGECFSIDDSVLSRGAREMNAESTNFDFTNDEHRLLPWCGNFRILQSVEGVNLVPTSESFDTHPSPVFAQLL